MVRWTWRLWCLTTNEQQFRPWASQPSCLFLHRLLLHVPVAAHGAFTASGHRKPHRNRWPITICAESWSTDDVTSPMIHAFCTSHIIPRKLRDGRKSCDSTIENTHTKFVYQTRHVEEKSQHNGGCSHSEKMKQWCLDNCYRMGRGQSWWACEKSSTLQIVPHPHRTPRGFVVWSPFAGWEVAITMSADRALRSASPASPASIAFLLSACSIQRTGVACFLRLALTESRPREHTWGHIFHQMSQLKDNSIAGTFICLFWFDHEGPTHVQNT